MLFPHEAGDSWCPHGAIDILMDGTSRRVAHLVAAADVTSSVPTLT